MTNLIHLQLNIGGSEVLNLEPLAKLTNLSHLIVAVSGERNVLDTYPEEFNRTRFHFPGNNLSDLEPLSKLVNLTGDILMLVIAK